MKKILIGRPIEGISLNGLEWLMNEDNKTLILFDDKQSAMEYARNNILIGATDEELEDNLWFEEEEGI